MTSQPVKVHVLSHHERAFRQEPSVSLLRWAMAARIVTGSYPCHFHVGVIGHEISGQTGRS
jgi:hypothetical protein